jgi:hypothetical protein
MNICRLRELESRPNRSIGGMSGALASEEADFGHSIGTDVALTSASYYV